MFDAKLASRVLRLCESKIRAYHGTSSTRVRSILKQGFLPNPKKKVWSDSGAEPELASFEGTYFTDHLFYALDSARLASTRQHLGGFPCVFEAMLETRNTLPDEDTFPDFGRIVRDVLSQDYKQRFSTEDVERAVDSWFEALFAGPKQNRNEKLESILREKLYRDVFQIMRLMFKKETNPEYMRALRNSHYSGVRQLKDDIARKLKGIQANYFLGSPDTFGKYFTSYRSLEGVGFKGSPRVLSGVVFNRSFYVKPNKYPKLYVFYGKVSEQLLTDWTERFSTRPELVPLSLVELEEANKAGELGHE